METVNRSVVAYYKRGRDEQAERRIVGGSETIFCRTPQPGIHREYICPNPKNEPSTKSEPQLDNGL